MPTVQVSFTGPDPAIDWVLSIDNENFGPAGVGIPINNLITNNDSYWAQGDINGIARLCTTKGVNRKKVINYLVGGAGLPQTTTAKAFRLEYFQNGEPAWYPSAD